VLPQGGNHLWALVNGDNIQDGMPLQVSATCSATDVSGPESWCCHREYAFRAATYVVKDADDVAGMLP